MRRKTCHRSVYNEWRQSTLAFEEVKVNEDSLSSGETVALYRPLNIEDQLFKYGVRLSGIGSGS